MFLLEKIFYIQKSLNLTEDDFLKNFKIKKSIFKSWVNKKEQPKKEDLILICEYFNLDLDDFVRNDSTLTKDLLKPGEHICKLKGQNYDYNNLVIEDFSKEDNSRYEERD